MKKQLLKIILYFTAGYLLLTAVLLCQSAGTDHNGGEGKQNGLVLLNEIEQMTAIGANESPVKTEIALLREELLSKEPEGVKSRERQIAVSFAGISVLYAVLVFFYVWFRILRPFGKLEAFAGRVAEGNLDVPLTYERTNFFGAFTWAFDHMREEINLARKNEAAAVNENKTIIATLSHDIKTPIASIRAYAEGLEAGLESGYEQRERYVSVIIRKCDEVTRLTNDLMLHSLSELERLTVQRQPLEMDQALEKILEDLEDVHVHLMKPFVKGRVFADEKRLAQVLENLLNNAAKYAPDTEISVSTKTVEEHYEISVRDHGNGILPEDMPFVLDKFYRGKNAGDMPGSGLGLYIVSYLMERMQGGITLENKSEGLEVLIWLPLFTFSAEDH